MDYFIGIDIGTTSTKALAIDTRGKTLGMQKQEYPVFSDIEGKHEEDPTVIFDAFVKVLAAVTGEVPPEYRLAGICFSAAMHGLLAVDEKGRPLTHLITWADTRAKAASEALKGTEAAGRIYQLTGTPIHPMSPLCKLIWLRSAFPEIFRLAHKFISIKEYVWYRLFGAFEVDQSIASATGLFDSIALTWSDLALTAAGITADRLSLPVPVIFQRQNLPEGFRQQLGIPAGVPFIIGAGDGCLANLGSGVVSPGEASVTIGTSGAVRVITPLWRPDPRERLFSYLLTDRVYVAGGAINNGGNILQWFTQLLKEDAGQLTTAQEDAGQSGVSPVTDLDALLTAAFSLPAGSGGLLFLPYLYGERAPMWDPKAKGAFIGLRPQHQRQHLLKAITEGICYALYDIFNILEEGAGTINIVYASGGFTHTEAWIQQLADVLNKPVCLNEEADASATGAALLGMLSLGVLREINDAKQHIKAGKTFYPNKDHHEVYQRCFTLYRSLYPVLKSTFEELDTLF